MSDENPHAHHGHVHNSPVVNATLQVTTMVVDALTKALTTSAPLEVHDNQQHGMGHESGADIDKGHGGHGVGDMGGMGHMMMYFNTGLNVTILFKEWTVHTAGGMVGAVIAVIIMALLYEGLKFLREQLFRQQYTRLSYTTCAVTTNSLQQQDGPAELHKVAETKILSWPHLLQTALHVTQVLLSYFLMLIFMTFNVWLCLGVLIGSGIGYFLFGWRKSTVVDISDHCH